MDKEALIEALPLNSKLIDQDFLLMKTLGQGKYSKVKMAKWLSKDRLVAMKIHKSVDGVDQVGLKKEIEIL